MIRRLVLAIVGTTTLAVVAFGIPLGIAVARMYRDEAVAKLERDAAAGVTEVSAPLSTSDLPELPVETDGTHVAVYDPAGRRVAGDGPETAEDFVRAGANGPVSSDDVNGSFVVAVPVGNDENVVGVMRA